MAMRNLIIGILLGIATSATAAQVDLAPIDRYLETWDRFAQGDNALVDRLNNDWPKARAALVKALEAKDRRAPSRIVFLTLVEVAGTVPVNSELGRAWRGYVGEAFPISDHTGEKDYAAWDFYVWWTKNPAPHDDLPLLRQWLSREFARTTVIPMYEQVLRQGAK